MLLKFSSAFFLVGLLASQVVSADSSVSVGSLLEPVDSVVIPDINYDGVDEMAILYRSDVGKTIVRIMDMASKKKIEDIVVGKKINPKSLDFMGDQDNDGQPEISVLAVTKAGVSKLFVKSISVTQNSKYHYTLQKRHPSGSISSGYNYIKLSEFSIENGIYEEISSCIIGGFTNKSEYYQMYYSSENKPENGYDKSAVYNGTPYKGMIDENEFYASPSKADLVDEIQGDITTQSCWRSAANFSGGNLNNDDNFWVYFCPKSGFIGYLNSALGDKGSSGLSCP